MFASMGNAGYDFNAGCTRKHLHNTILKYNETFCRKTGAGEAIRTLDPNLGKVVLYP